MIFYEAQLIFNYFFVNVEGYRYSRQSLCLLHEFCWRFISIAKSELWRFGMQSSKISRWRLCCGDLSENSTDPNRFDQILNFLFSFQWINGKLQFCEEKFSFLFQLNQIIKKFLHPFEIEIKYKMYFIWCNYQNHHFAYFLGIIIILFVLCLIQVRFTQQSDINGF